MTLSILSDDGLDHNDLAIDGNCFTTDDGSGNTGQLGIINCISRVTCSEHKISTVLGTVLRKTTTTSDGIRSARVGSPYYSSAHRRLQGVDGIFLTASKQTVSNRGKATVLW
jgi:hypothetical protein